MNIWKVSHGKKDISDKDVDWLNENQYITVHKNTGKSQNENFIKDLKSGDIVFITRSSDVVGLVRVVGDLVKDSKPPVLYPNWLLRRYEKIIWLSSAISFKSNSDKKGWFPNYNSTFMKVLPEDFKYFEDEILQPIFSLSVDRLLAGENGGLPSLNQILFGPPGTGKTYNTISEAIKIINPDLYDDGKGERKDIKKEFDRLLKKGQIAFTTFHQSFGYEDFVEGIKAETVNNQVNYSVESGIFKELCEQADESGNAALIAFNDAINSLKDDLSNGESIELETEIKNKKFTVTYYGNKIFHIKPDAGKSVISMSIESFKKFYRNSKTKNNSESYKAPIFQYLKENYGLTSYKQIEKTQKTCIKEPYILIIDEINRGNISKIFGELITLIEPDKRKGTEEEISVILPYSKESFSVPKNVYIIGTMNTADASIAKLDVALRRRFDFIEMPPKPDLLKDINKKDIEVEGVNLKEMLTAINTRIEILYDREHTIGHSFFMKLHSSSEIEELAAVFEKNIIPLLQEYFFDDWQRIHWVLGDHLKPEGLQFIKEKNASADLKRLMGDKWKKENEVTQWQLNDNAFNNPKAYSSIYHQEESKTETLESNSE